MWIIKPSRCSNALCTVKSAGTTSSRLSQESGNETGTPGRTLGLYAAMTVAAAPYLRQTDFYFSPLKIVEYLAAGLPVVASDQGDLAHLVGKAGLMVSPDDAVELADALDKVLGDPELRRAMHFAARRHAAGMSWDAAAAQVETALISAVARSRSAAFNRETA